MRLNSPCRLTSPHLIAVLLCFSLTGCYYSEVDAGKLYRSPQPSADDIARAASLGIKTVINLRGEAPGSDWYDAEKAATAANGITQIDISMSASRLPHREDLIKLLDAFKTAVRPILIHCRAGVDRTGEAAALYEILYMNKSTDEALEMLSPRFGHFEIFTPAKAYFVRSVWQGEQWARERYDPCIGQYKYYDANSSTCKEGGVAPLLPNDDT